MAWTKFEVGGRIIKAKEIYIYAAKRRMSTNTTVCLDVGYCLNLPKALKTAVPSEEKILLHHVRSSFYKEGKLPLRFLFQKTDPDTWDCDVKEQEITFRRFVTAKNTFCTFELKTKNTIPDENCMCIIKAGQGKDLLTLSFSLQEPSSSTYSSAGSAKSELTQPKKRKSDQLSVSLAGSSRSGLTSVADDTLTDPLTLSYQPLDSTKGAAVPSAKQKYFEYVVPDHILQELSKEILNEWKDIGRKLKLEEGDLNTLTYDTREGQMEINYQMLLKWKQKHGSQATFTVLGEALKLSGRTDLMEFVHAKGKFLVEDDKIILVSSYKHDLLSLKETH